MSERRKLSVTSGDRSEGQDPRRGWGVSPARLERLKAHAREMRRNPTEPEQALWDRMQGQQMGGFKFKRQVVIGSAIADFACEARWLIVEVDGDAHDTPAIDAMRDQKLTDVGLRVLRFRADRVADDMDGVCAEILTELQKPFERPGSNATGTPQMQEFQG